MPAISAAMSRRAFACGFGSVLTGLPSAGSAQPRQGDFFGGRWIAPPPPWGYWKIIPAIVVLSDPKDPRLPAVHEAVRFWNDVFLNLGSPFRLGPVTHISEITTEDDSRRDSLRVVNQLLKSSGSADLLTPVGNLSGDVFVVLSDYEGSFAITSHVPKRVLVVIRAFTYQSNPPSVPSGRFLENTIAHELGHAVGLGHNDGTRTLMCRPCRREVLEGFAPLTDDEKRQLLEMYPPNWRAES